MTLIVTIAVNAVAYTVQDPDDGALGDTFIFIGKGEETGAGDKENETTIWIEKVRSDKGLTEPLQSETGKTILEEIEKPPLAQDEVRFEVDAQEGWIEYLVNNDTVILYNDAVVEYQDMTLLAEKIEFESDNDLVVAEGRALLIDPDQEMLAERMAYNMKKRFGIAYDATSEAKMGYYTGKRIKQTDRKEFNIYWGTFTTDALANPNYRFWSPKIKVFINDKVIARPAVLYMGEVPVFAVPYYFFYLKKGRRSGILAPYIRYTSSGNFTVNNGFYWAINDYCDITTYLDYSSISGWRKSMNFVYLYGSRATVNNIYVSQNRDRVTHTNWWKVNASHRQDFSNTFAALARVDIRSENTYDEYFVEDFDARTADSLETFLNVTKNWDKYQATLLLRHTETTTKIDDDSDTDPGDGTGTNNTKETSNDVLPEVAFSGTRGEVFNTGFYYYGSLKAGNYYENGVNTMKQAIVSGALSRPVKFFGWLRVDPSLNGTDTIYDRDIYGYNVRNLFKWNSSVSTSTKIYGLFDIGENRLRHTIGPNVTYNYTPEIDQSWLVKGASISPKSSYLTLSLSHSFDLKLAEEEEEDTEESELERETGDTYGRGDTGSDDGDAQSGSDYGSTSNVINLLKWTLSTKYDLLDPMYSANAKEIRLGHAVNRYQLGDLTSLFDINPKLADWYNFKTSINSVYDINHYLLNRWDVSTAFSFTTAGLGVLDDERGTSTDSSWNDATDRYGNQEDPQSDDYDPNVYNIDGVTGRTYGPGEGMGKGWNFSLSHSYTKDRWDTMNLHSLRGAVSLNLTKKWRLGYDNYYDIEEDKLISEHYRIYRNLRHWEAEIRISFERSEVIYWFQIRLIDLPDIRLYNTRRKQQ